MATPIVKDSAGQKLAVCLLRLPREKGLAARSTDKNEASCDGRSGAPHFLLSDRLRYPTTSSQNQGYVRLA